MRCHEQVDALFGKVFASYGRFVARHPVKVMFAAILVNCLLGIGLLKLKVNSDIEDLYTPVDSQASQDRSNVQGLFPLSGTAFYSQQQADLGLYGIIIISTKSGSNVLNFLDDIKSIYNYATNTSFKSDDGEVIEWSTVCARRFSECVVDGGVLITDLFDEHMQNGSIPYPNFPDPTSGRTTSLETSLGQPETSNGVLQQAKAVRLQLYLRHDTSVMSSNSKLWEIQFLERMESFTQLPNTDVFYSSSQSLSIELDKNIAGDILYITVTFTLICVYATLAPLGCNCVSNRGNLGNAGVAATALSILAAFGLASACGVEFVSLVGVMPFLILGIHAFNFKLMLFNYVN
jgi:hypothetical protein